MAARKWNELELDEKAFVVSAGLAGLGICTFLTCKGIEGVYYTCSKEGKKEREKMKIARAEQKAIEEQEERETQERYRKIYNDMVKELSSKKSITDDDVIMQISSCGRNNYTKSKLIDIITSGHNKGTTEMNRSIICSVYNYDIPNDNIIYNVNAIKNNHIKTDAELLTESLNNMTDKLITAVKKN